MSEPRPDQSASVDRPAGAPPRLPGDRPPRRLLDQAPSQRLAARRPAADGGTGAGLAAAGAAEGSARRAAAYGALAAAGGAAAHLFASVVLLWTGGLLVVAVTLGIMAGLAVAAGGGSGVPAGARRALAVTLALAGLAGALVANWALSGMYLGPPDYLAQVYGALVPVEVALAVAGALAGSR